jgi:predicted amidohydrolase YtcJ
MKSFRRRASSTRFAAFLLLVLLSVVTACTAEPEEVAETASVIYTNGNFVTMNPDQPSADAVAVSPEGTILAVGDQDDMEPFEGPDTQTEDLDGATALPGFIDTHSHLAGYAFFSDTEHWLDLSSENYYFKPTPDDPRCPADKKDDPQACFIPVKNHDEAIGRLKAYAEATRGNLTTPILAFGYDASRFGATPGCNGVSWACPNLQDGNGLAMLDAVDPGRPILVAASSGHFAYANSAALTLLNICPPANPPAGCHTPIINPNHEMALAQTGVLVEDLTEYAIGFFQAPLLKDNPGLGPQLMSNAIEIYANQGFTLTQEGSTDDGLLATYDELFAHYREEKKEFPVTVAILAYAGTDDIQDSIKVARAAEETDRRENLFAAAVKTFADGSTPGYSALLSEPYLNVFPPLTPPYSGLGDYNEGQLSQQIAAVHEAGLPMAIHVNGDLAADNALAALQENHDPDIKDIVIHLAVTDPDDANMGIVKELEAGLTFLINDLYYYGMPLCDQMLGAPRAADMYPTNDAVEQDIPFGLHSDTPVTPPDPLFMIWVAATRQFQQQEWRPNQNPAQCTPPASPEQKVTIEQGVEAFTTSAALMYGIEDERGSLEVGKLAEMTLLSANPLDMESNPDQLSTIQVEGTVHKGVLHPNPDAGQPVIWPS